MLKIEIQKESDLPVYMQLRDSLKQLIKQKQFQPMEKLPNVTEIAAAAGVSIRTADIALQELVRQGVCFRRPKKGTFVSVESEHARYPVCGVWSNFSLTSPLSYPMHYFFHSEVTENARDIGVGILTMTKDSEKLIQRYDQSEEFDFRGIIVFDFDKFDKVAALAKKFPQKKFFYLNYVTDKFDLMPDNMYAIVNDDFGGAYSMVEHFISQQADSFMILSQQLPDGDYTYRERIRGFCRAIGDYSAAMTGDVIEAACGRNSQLQAEIAFLAIKKAIRFGKAPNVILCTNGSLALGALRAVESENADIRIAGYDGINQYFFGAPPFPTVQVRVGEMARQALLIMDGKIKVTDNVIKVVPKLQIADRKGFMYA